MTTKAQKEPTVVAVEKMPPRHLGRPSVDVGALQEAIEDRKPHAVTHLTSEQQRKLWRRRLRKAAQHADMRVQTVYVESEGRLYFQGRASD
jgi:hypothetical protein